MQSIADRDPYTRQLFEVRSYVSRQLRSLHRRTLILRSRAVDLEDQAAELGGSLEQVVVVRRRQDSPRLRVLLAELVACRREEEQIRQGRFALSTYLLDAILGYEVHLYQTQSQQELFGGLIPLYDAQLVALVGLSSFLERAHTENTRARSRLWIFFGWNE